MRLIIEKKVTGKSNFATLIIRSTDGSIKMYMEGPIDFINNYEKQFIKIKYELDHPRCF
jgi:hypothetical protein